MATWDAMSPNYRSAKLVELIDGYRVQQSDAAHFLAEHNKNPLARRTKRYHRERETEERARLTADFLQSMLYGYRLAVSPNAPPLDQPDEGPSQRGD